MEAQLHLYGFDIRANGKKVRPLLALDATMKRFDLLCRAQHAAVWNGFYNYSRIHWVMPGMARHHMKKERGLCR